MVTTLMEKENFAIVFLVTMIILSNIVIAQLSSPNINSETHKNNVISNKNYAVINIQENQEVSYYLYQLTTNEQPNDSKWVKTTKTKITFSNLIDGKHNFFVKACKEESCSDYSKFTILIDRTGPSPPTNIKSFSTKKGILLTWNEAKDDAGIKKYFVYRNLRRNYLDREFLPIDLGVKKFETFTNYFNDEDGLQKGIAYYYRIQAVDNADNQGAISSIIIGRNNWDECENSITIKTNENMGFKVSNVEIESNQEISNVKASIIYDNESQEVFDEKTPGKNFNFTIKPKENYFGKAILKIEYADSMARICETQKSLKIDSIAPKIESIKQKFEGEKIIVNALILDDDEIKKAEIISDGIVIAEGKKTSQNTYEFVIEKKVFAKEIHLRAYDVSENYSEKTISLEKNIETEKPNLPNIKEEIFEINTKDTDKEILTKIVFALIFLVILITIGMLYNFYAKSQTKVKEQVPKEEQKPKWKEKPHKNKINAKQN